MKHIHLVANWPETVLSYIPDFAYSGATRLRTFFLNKLLLFLSISSKPKEIFPHLSIRKVKANESIKGAETIN